jgi:hypothetical protein
MGHFLYFNRLKPLFLFVILTTFSLTSSLPVYAQFNLNEAALLYRLEKLIEKIWKMEKKGKINDVLDIALDIKSEIETSYNVSLDIDTFFNQVERDVKTRGHKIPNHDFKMIKNKLKQKDKNRKDHGNKLSTLMFDENYDFDFEGDQLIYASKSKDKDKNDEKEEIKVPYMLVWGVTLALSGFFLCCLPIPICKDWGAKMAYTGVTICGSCIAGKMDNDEKDKDKDKKR